MTVAATEHERLVERADGTGIGDREGDDAE